MLKEIVDSEGTIVFTDFQKDCCNCLSKSSVIGTGGSVCNIDGTHKHIAHIITSHGDIYACSYGSKTTRNFIAELEALKIGQRYYTDIKKQIVKETLEDEKKRVIRLVHNLKTT